MTHSSRSTWASADARGFGMQRTVDRRQPTTASYWVRLRGEWGLEEWLALHSLCDGIDLPTGGVVVLDMTSLEHVHYQSVPLLLCLAEMLALRGATLQVTGLSIELQRIVELGAGLDGREFLERHAHGGRQDASLPGPAGPGYEREGRLHPFVMDPHGPAAASLN